MSKVTSQCSITTGCAQFYVNVVYRIQSKVEQNIPFL